MDGETEEGTHSSGERVYKQTASALPPVEGASASWHTQPRYPVHLHTSGDSQSLLIYVHQNARLFHCGDPRKIVEAPHANTNSWAKQNILNLWMRWMYDASLRRREKEKKRIA